MPSVPFVNPPQQKKLRLTRLQLSGIRIRESRLKEAAAAAAAAQANLNSYLSGIVNGHHIDRSRTIEYDDERMTLTIELPQKAEA